MRYENTEESFHKDGTPEGYRFPMPEDLIPE